MRARFPTLALVLLLALGCGAAGAESPGAKARVTWIVDGDTISVRVGASRERVRLIGVDTPEANDVRDDYKQAAYDARDWLIAKLKNKTVVLERDPLGDDRDKHGRLLRYVYLDGENVNVSLVRQGLGWAYTRYKFAKKAEFVAAEREARSDGRGVWTLAEGRGRKTR
jgi:micrococcal nuclease